MRKISKKFFKDIDDKKLVFTTCNSSPPQLPGPWVESTTDHTRLQRRRVYEDIFKHTILPSFSYSNKRELLENYFRSPFS